MNTRSLLSGLAKLRDAKVLTTLAALCFTSTVQAQVGNLLWEENFDTFDTSRWNYVEGNGCQYGPDLCGWGNQELQWYSRDNVSIQPIPGEPGNSALVFEARDEWVENSAFTSGKVDSKDNIAVQYGLVEIRMRVPNVDMGLWPAAWLLGTSTATWPAKGEIDMMEMGQARFKLEREGLGNTPLNNFVASNLIFYADGACNQDNPTCAASSGWDPAYNTPYVSTVPMNDRFVTYRMYWTETEIRLTIVDGDIEHDLHASPFPIGGEASEFQAPFYFLLNLAVGGNFTDALSNDQVTAPLPGRMYIDYIRVYEWAGQGEVFVGNTTRPETGTFGVYTDDTPTNNKLQAGQSSDIWVWDPSTTGGSEAPFEGSEVISWQISGTTWFGGGIQSRQAVDLSNFSENGQLVFRIHAPADVSFRVGITDTFGNENWVEFPANQDRYGLSRNGEWGQVTIPASDIRGDLIALQSLSYVFAITGDPHGSAFNLAIDDVYWEGGGGEVDTDGDGIFDSQDDCPNTPTGAIVDSRGCPIDTDGDGVYDGLDQCPNSAPGANVDADGCAVVIVPVTVRVEAEDFVDFFDSDSGNNGDVPISTGDVDVESCSDAGCGYNVGWTDAGEWLTYNLNLVPGVTYDVTTRVASQVSTGSYSLSLNETSFASDSVMATGGWQSWVDHNLSSVTATGDTQILRLDVTGPSFNINWIEFVPRQIIDTDGDGIADDNDLCPNTPENASVNSVGCPDSDGDSVFDNLDECANTPAGVPVNSVGCPDSDGDGVFDNLDQCPNTTAGVQVDEQGCEISGPEPIRVQAEDYVNFSDSDAGNNGATSGFNDDVDVEATTDAGGGFNVGWTEAGEWLEYNVVLNPGTYDVTSRVASDIGGGAYSVLLDAVSFASDTVAATGGWQVWESHRLGQVTVNSAGQHTLRVNISGGSFNLNWLHFEPANVNPNQQTPFLGSAVSIPGTVEAENYDLGGADIAFHDLSAGNAGEAYRNDDVDIESASTGGFNIGYVQAGEWLEYTIDVSSADRYFLTTLVASANSGGSLSYQFSGATNLSGLVMNVTGTGGWQNWVNTSSLAVDLNAGEHVVRLTVESGEFNINSFTLDNSSPPSPPPTPEAYPGYTGVYANFTLNVDERFDGSDIDADVWSKGDGGFPENDCRFQPQGVQVRDGKMELVVRAEHVPGSFSNDQGQFRDAKNHSCGELRMKNKIQHGRIEARFRTPQSGATGFITSLFTYDSEDFQWREIDIELEGGRPGSMQSNLIFGDNADQWNFEWQATRTWGAWERLHNTPRSTPEWIVYAIEWTPDYIAWFMDGVEVRRIQNESDGLLPLVHPAIIRPYVPRKPTTVMMNFWIPTPVVMHGFGGDTSGNVYPMVAQYDWFRFYQYTPGTP